MTDLNLDPLFGTINNGFEITEGATDEVSDDSASLGQLFLAVIVLVVAGIAVALLFGIPQKMLSGLAGVMKKIKM